MANFEIIDYEGQKMIRATINNETIRAEAGALHYMHGQIEMESKAPSAGGFLRSMVTSETIFKPTYTGTGVVYFGPPIFGEYVTLTLNNEEWILDQGAYVCSDISIEVSSHRNKAATALLGGEGLFQTSVKGTGNVVIQAPGKVQRIDLNGEKLSVDGSFAVARSAALTFKVEKATRSFFGSMTSGEGLLNTFQGVGPVMLAPVPNLYQSMVDKCRAFAAAPTQTKGKGCSFGMVLLASATGVGLALGALAMSLM